MTNEAASPALLKDILGPQALETIGDAGVAASRHFDHAAFLSAASDGLDALSIMERVRHIADALHAALPGDYAAALDVVRAMAPRLTHAFQAMAVTEYVARYGLDDFDPSMDALADLTRFGSAEFAIRPFLAADTRRALTVMARWASNEDEHVRRLASEGARPRLPWAARIPALKSDPTLAAPILEILKADPSLYVRKSVANHLNDIAKDRPDWLLDRLATWPQDNARTVWIVRHALRTLIKKGDPAALALIGVGHGAAVSVRDFSIAPSAVHLGDRIAITANLASDSSENQRLVVDYRVHYARAGGKSAAKVFKLKTFELAAGETASLGISQTIRDFSTRRHHPGRHEVELIVNGQTMATAAFEILSAA
ncbi:DNA-3-methylpurine glycosylase [Sphingopyxis sp. LC81]|uniref:DNA alkylation repair protein n=1 Tax=Sphingopyxis sp. LC81 TaxID=1502850 RepID=UPI00050DEA6A|nr:DNA alkylation repair protein [Sphingopyxis sp. LC81]KGB53260.1 DNA-3-methylpurine glycosylase [Sphingopyxis sp. LC81]